MESKPDLFIGLVRYSF